MVSRCCFNVSTLKQHHVWQGRAQFFVKGGGVKRQNLEEIGGSGSCNPCGLRSSHLTSHILASYRNLKNAGSPREAAIRDKQYLRLSGSSSCLARLRTQFSTSTLSQVTICDIHRLLSLVTHFSTEPSTSKSEVTANSKLILTLCLLITTIVVFNTFY